MRVELADRSYDIHVGPDLLQEAGGLIGELGLASRLVIVTNPTVSSLYLGPLQDALAPLSIAAEPLVIEIPDGERFKTLDTVATIYDAVLDLGGDRSVMMIALGGGVVGDLAGFAAATIFRGIRLVMVPTTLLAQVDSSVGGKTGVDRPQGKNLVGAFYQPEMVLADTGCLATLPEREYRAGIAEVVKYGVILDAGLFELLENNISAIEAGDARLIAKIVARCCEIKAGVVARDERDTGARAVLNFGHTVAHAIEKLGGYSRFVHGEAVAIGMVAAVRVSASLGLCDPSLADRLRSLLESFGLDCEIPSDIEMESLASAIFHDKKVRACEVLFIVSEGLGRCRQRALTPAEITRAL